VASAADAALPLLALLLLLLLLLPGSSAALGACLGSARGFGGTCSSAGAGAGLGRATGLSPGREGAVPILPPLMATGM
jgi:hypothetical protein